jgi:hypothetical protein
MRRQPQANGILPRREVVPARAYAGHETTRGTRAPPSNRAVPASFEPRSGARSNRLPEGDGGVDLAVGQIGAGLRVGVRRATGEVFQGAELDDGEVDSGRTSGRSGFVLEGKRYGAKAGHDSNEVFFVV